MNSTFQEKIHSKKPAILAYLQNLGIAVAQIQNEELLLQTFVHKSFSADYKDTWNHNERLEFVGDGILGAVINKMLFLNNPLMPESELTLYKIALVREEILAEVARDIHLDTVLFVSRGEERSEGRKKDSILSDALEALIGFLYIELGTEEVEQFIAKYIYSKFVGLQKTSVKSYKTMVQELVQKEFKVIPEYIDTEVDVDAKGNVLKYKSDLYLSSEKKSEGFGTNKKKAQEDAAKEYYLKVSS
ncbi:MAG: ribonuclease III [candidate division SR1 bacterium]|nr:ribonuclease III [candidate division SR1 bacterium]